jgi:hypothetical protein
VFLPRQPLALMCEAGFASFLRAAARYIRFVDEETPIPEVQPEIETFAEKFARLWITLDDEPTGSEIIFANKQLAETLQRRRRVRGS